MRISLKDFRGLRKARGTQSKRAGFLTLCVLGALTGVVWGAPQQLSPRYYIAHKYDATRIVVELEDVPITASGLSQQALHENPTRLPDPLARLSMMKLWGMNKAFWKEHRQFLESDKPGDFWILKTGARTILRCRIEKFVFAEMYCARSIVAIARVEPQDQATFQSVREKYFLALRAPEYVPAPPASPEPVQLKQPPRLDATATKRLEAVLGEQMALELPEVVASSRQGYARWSDELWVQTWQSFDKRLTLGEGKLSYDLQAFCLTPDGQPRLFVRAQWVLNGKTVFLLSAWLRPDQDMQVEALQSSPSQWMRMREFRFESMGLQNLGLILNVFDFDGDGWGEILFYQHGYEGFSIQLLQYRGKAGGLQDTGVVYGHGC